MPLCDSRFVDAQGQVVERFLGMKCVAERAVFATIQNDDILQHFQELKTRKKKLPSSNTSGMLHVQ
jgi:hypothetical protein